MSSFRFLFFGKRQSTYQKIRTLFEETEHIHTSNLLLQHIQKRLPHVLFFGDAKERRSILRLIATIRSRYPMAQIPILIIANSKWPPHFTEALGQHVECYILFEEQVPTRLKDRVDLLVERNYDDRPEGLLHPHALSILIDCWREKRNGIIQRNDNDIQIRNGGIAEINGEEKLLGFLNDGIGFFKALNIKESGDWITTTNMCWEAVTAYCHPGFLSSRLNLCFVEKSGCERLFALPLSKACQDFLFRSPVEETIRNRLHTLKLAQSKIETELEALYRMGLYHFTRPKVIKSSKKDTSHNFKTPKNESAAWLAMNSDVQATHTERVKLEVLSTLPYSPSFRKQRFLREQALEKLLYVERAKQNFQKYFTEDSNSDVLFSESFAALTARHLPKAYRMSKQALENDSSSLRNQIFFIWTSYLLAPKHLDIRYQELEFLYQRTENPIILLFLAALDSQRGDFSQAEAKIERLIDNGDSLGRWKRLQNILKREKPLPLMQIHQWA